MTALSPGRSPGRTSTSFPTTTRGWRRWKPKQRTTGARGNKRSMSREGPLTRHPSWTAGSSAARGPAAQPPPIAMRHEHRRRGSSRLAQRTMSAWRRPPVCPAERSLARRTVGSRAAGPLAAPRRVGSGSACETAGRPAAPFRRKKERVLPVRTLSCAGAIAWHRPARDPRGDRRAAPVAQSTGVR